MLYNPAMALKEIKIMYDVIVGTPFVLYSRNDAIKDGRSGR